MVLADGLVVRRRFTRDRMPGPWTLPARAKLNAAPLGDCVEISVEEELHSYQSDTDRFLV